VATVPAVRRSRMQWHVRGTWSTRDDRVPSAVWLGILWVGMSAGFGVDIPGFQSHHPPAILWVHGAVFTVWMLLLTAQVLLVMGDRLPWHRKLGWFAAGWACLMAVMGPLAAMVAQAFSLRGPFFDPPFLSVNIVDIGSFLVLLAWGISLRRNPAAHKRMMILATVALADPGFSRFSGFYIPTEPQSLIPWFFWVFYGNLILILLMAAWDWWRGRLIRSFVIGASGLVAALFLASALYFWEPWKALTLEWVTAWAKHFA
jgi:hypothetical protein